MPFQPAGYLTAQLGVSPSDPRGLQIVNLVGSQLESTGLNDGVPASILRTIGESSAKELANGVWKKVGADPTC